MEGLCGLRGSADLGPTKGHDMSKTVAGAAITMGVLGAMHCSGGASPSTNGSPMGQDLDAMAGDVEAGSSGSSGAGASGTASGASGTGAGSSAGSGATGASGSATHVLTVQLVGPGIGESVNSDDGMVNCGPGPVVPPCSVSYPAGTQVNLTATTGDIHFSFGGWIGAGCSGMANCMLTMTSAQTVTATFHATLTYTDNDMLIVPTGISMVNVALWGGGGQGGFTGTFNSSLSCYTGTGGGGGGAYNTQSVPVAPGDPVPITVGCGGCVISSDMNQFDLGGETSFGALLSAGGGGGGSDSPPTGGAGGSCIGPGCIAGTPGTMGSTASCSGGNGGAAGGPDGGAGGVYGTNFGNGGVPAGGGAGSEGINGGLGGPGQAVVSW